MIEPTGTGKTWIEGEYIIWVTFDPDGTPRITIKKMKYPQWMKNLIKQLEGYPK